MLSNERLYDLSIARNSMNFVIIKECRMIIVILWQYDFRLLYIYFINLYGVSAILYMLQFDSVVTSCRL